MNTINLVAVLFLFTSAICTPTVLAGDIHEAAEKGDLARVKVLLQADPSLLNAEGHDFTTPLHWAAARGHRELAEWLLSKKPKLEAADRYGMTPLLTAAQNGQNALVELLIKHGANVEAQDKSGKSSLHWAAIFNRQDVVQTLLGRKVNADVRDRHNETALQKAKQNGHQDIVKLFMQQGVKE